MHTRRPPRALRAALLALVLAGAGCTRSSLSGPSSAERMDYLAARARWTERGAARYSWVYQRGWCECLPEWMRPLYVEVDGPTAVRVYDAETRAPITDVRANEEAPTVEYVFAVIGDALERGVYHLRADYHPVYGYPMLVEVNYDRAMVDDEFRIETREFTVR